MVSIAFWTGESQSMREDSQNNLSDWAPDGRPVYNAGAASVIPPANDRHQK